LPDNPSPGTLEDILLESAAEVWPRTLQLANGYVVAASQTITASELNRPAGINKATVACISNLLRPGKAVQVSIQDNDWLTSAPLNTRLKDFLHQLLRLPA
ncbi:MAG: hypothetical protein KBH45_18950, partial [Verrucomicrobia bacterium]|nr:hypothetical protein [Verrucomicrobiota bacterium]